MNRDIRGNKWYNAFANLFVTIYDAIEAHAGIGFGLGGKIKGLLKVEASRDMGIVLDDCGKRYSFELPMEIYQDWKRSAGEQYRDALRVKQEYFSKIVIFNKTDGDEENISILNLSSSFMEEAKKSIRREDQGDF